MSTLFISDLHLDDRRPAVTALFRDWLRREAKQADALYVLGDLFEAYIGDDDDAPLIATVADALLDDVAYQRIRVQLRHPDWQRQFLAQPLAARRAFAAQARAESAKHTGAMDLAIMDVTASAVDAALDAAGVRRMIHGHTHRPAVHELGDQRHGSVLRIDHDGLALATLPLPV